MSAPYQGRQSPPPSRQTGTQETDPMTAGKVHDTTASSATQRTQDKQQQQQQDVVSEDTKGESERSKEFTLESNPVHPLEHEAEVKAAKWMPQG